MTKVDYTLSGCANGHPVRIEGKGTATGKGLQVAFTAVEEVRTFDAQLAHFAGLDAVVALSAGLAVGHDDPVVGRSRADVVTEGGVEVGTIVAAATVQRGRGRVVCRAQLVEARVGMEVGERITVIGERRISAAPVGTGVALFSATTVRTSRGREWTVLVTTMLVGCDGGERDVVTVSAMRC